MKTRNILFKERLPLYVFKGRSLKRSSIVAFQWATRMLMIGTIVAAIFLIFSSNPTPGQNVPIRYFADLILSLGAVILYYQSEVLIQKQLDGTARIQISEDDITIPPRLHRRIIRKPNTISKDRVDHIEIVRGSGNQYIDNNNGIRWIDTPIAFKIVLKNGRNFFSGYKPPNTIQDAVGVLKDRGGISITDSGNGLGRGRRYIRDNTIGEYSYEEIMMMNLFEWLN